ncbi:HEAT repeat domain-containing protein [bacterium]|nr:HEAT repeat domain-containing protein [bacterium]
MSNVFNKSIPELVHIVRESEDVSARREALIALGYEQDPSLYSLFMEQLSDKSRSIRHAAVISLGRYGNPAAIDELVKPKILNAPVMNIRWAVVAALGKLGNYKVIDYLVQAAADPEWIVRNQAVTELKEKILEIIESHEPRASRILVRLLAMDDEEIVELAVENMTKLGVSSHGLLLESLKSPSATMRKNASLALGRMKVLEAVSPLISLLHDENWQVRRNVVESLGLIQDPQSIESLVQRLGDNVEKVQRQARLSLVAYGSLSTDPLLNALIHEKSKFVLRAMLLTLGDIGDPKSVPALIKHLGSSYFVVRRAAVQALIRFGSDIIKQLLYILSFNESDIGSFLKDISNTKHPHLQLRAIHALEGLEDHRAVKILKRQVEVGTEEVKEAARSALIRIGCAAWSRCSALQVLREIGDKKILPNIIHMLHDDSENVRLEAVLALGKINSGRVIQPLIEVASSDSDPYVRFEVIRQLRIIGVGYPEVLELALCALSDTNRDVRSQAAWLLGNFQDKRSIPALLKATSDAHWSVRESAEIALHNFGTKAVPQLIDALKSRSWTTQLRAARLLGDLGDKRAIGSLEKLHKKSRLRKEVYQVIEEALQKIGEKC